jgi:hypothetical protein
MNHAPSCACDLCRSARRLGLSPEEVAAADLGSPSEPGRLQPASGRASPSYPKESRVRGYEKLKKELEDDAERLRLFPLISAQLDSLKVFVGHDLELIPKGEPGGPGWRCKLDCRRCSLDHLLEAVRRIP